MPVSVINSYAEKFKLNKKELEDIWEEAKKITENKFKIKEKDFDKDQWKYVMSVFKKIVKNKYDLTNLENEFLDIEFRGFLDNV